MFRKRFLLSAVAVALVAGLAWLLVPAPLAVDLAEVAAGPMQVTVDDVGETRSRDRFVVSAPVAGRLARIGLRDGDPVTAGQLLATIAPLPLAARELQELNARVAAAEAAAREADQRVRHADEDLAQARREHARAKRLVQEGFLSPQSLEQSGNREITAASEAEAARFRARSAAAEVEVARAGLVATRRTAAGDAGRVEVRAPAAGRILRIPEASERVVAAGTALMSIGDLDGLEIVAELLSTEAVRVAPGMPVIVEGWGGDRALRARVRRVEPYAVTKVSALGVEEKRVNVVADFVDPPGAIGDGYRVTVRIVTWQAESVLKVPASALFRCAETWCVFTDDDGRARRRTIDLGQRNMLEAEVRAGLAAGQRVIRFPANDLADGVRIQGRRRAGDEAPASGR